MTDLVKISDDQSVRLIRMNRVDKKNALNAPMYDAMTAAIEEAQTAPSIHCLMIAGAPGAFCAGNDLKDFQDAARESGGLGHSVIAFLYALARNRKPLVAAVQGVAVGIGTTMLFHCDYVVAGTDARFSTPFVSLGLVPEAASSLLAPRLMGNRRAFALLVMGQPLDAPAAKECGLVNAVAAPAETDAQALQAAHHIARLPPEAVAVSRKLVRGAPDAIADRIDEEADFFRARLQSAEAQAAFEAFFARKK
jgi:enoyl-CoA hydratase/carnithine racemase